MADAPQRPHLILIRVMFTVATILAVFAVLAVWVNRQALNADNWSNTSASVLADPAVKQQVADYLVDEVYANVDVAGQIRTALPPRLQPLAGPVAGGLRQFATRTTLTLLSRPRVEKAWQEANRHTAQQFINIAEGKSGAITAGGNAVVLDLRVIVQNLVQRLGLPGRLSSSLPEGSGRIVILRSDQVKTLQRGVRLLKSLALILPILSFGLFGLGVYLGRGRRRMLLMWAGIDLIAAGVLALLARNLLGGYVVDALAGDGPVRPAAEASWSIGTSMLRDVGQAVIIGALPLLLAAWLAGPSRPAVGARWRMAPFLREHVGASYAVLAALLVLIIAWGPIPATHKVIPVLVMSALAALGLRLLRRQTLEEFPPVAPAADGAGPPAASEPEPAAPTTVAPAG